MPISIGLITTLKMAAILKSLFLKEPFTIDCIYVHLKTVVKTVDVGKCDDDNYIIVHVHVILTSSTRDTRVMHS